MNALRPSNKLKPNTRFLRNIIKGTNRHNEALLAKEQSESQARLKDLAEAEEEKRRKYRPSANEIRGRQLGNITALLTGQSGRQKRKRPAADEEVSDMQKARATEDARRLADTAAVRKRQRDKDGKRRRSLERYSVRKSKDDDKDDDDTYYRQNTSSDDEKEREADRRRRHRERSRSPRSKQIKYRHRSPLGETREGKRTEGSSDRSRRRNSQSTDKPTRLRSEEEDADSDPLEDLIGPKPPPKVLPRGRGALRGSSGMDNRFSSDYDPKSDVQMDDHIMHDDWDEALEALRDRAKWKQQGADRLREAGFTEEQVKKWEKGDEKTIDDVQWTKAGEKREWDRGKDVEDGNDD